MLDPASKPNVSGQEASASYGSRYEYPHGMSARSHTSQVLEKPKQLPEQPLKKRDSRRPSLPQNFLLKWLHARYWQRLLRYFYIRFLRMRSSPKAIARGMAAGVFAGSFPLLGLQTIIGVAIASCIRGNKVVAAASTWISNPFTYVPLFALNFHMGRWLLRLPSIELPSSAVGIRVWMEMGMGVVAALMLGSFITGIVFSIAGYYAGLRIGRRVRTIKAAKARRKKQMRSEQITIEAGSDESRY